VSNKGAIGFEPHLNKTGIFELNRDIRPGTSGKLESEIVGIDANEKPAGDKRRKFETDFVQVEKKSHHFGVFGSSQHGLDLRGEDLTGKRFLVKNIFSGERVRESEMIRG
jgi:hypothetical protein